MTRTLAVLTLTAALSGCATVHEVATSRDTMVACQAADVVTTAVALNGGAVEANPLMAKLISHGWLPFIALKVALTYVVYQMNAPPPVQAAFNVASCAPIPINLGVILK